MINMSVWMICFSSLPTDMREDNNDSDNNENI